MNFDEPTLFTDMMTRQDSDQPARDAAMSDLDHSMIIEAGAGTGKTTILTARIIEFIKSGRGTVDQIVAITFTDAAAAELKQRVRDKIAEALADLEGQLPREERQRLESALSGIERAPISTIHSFANSLLRERPVEAGIDPQARCLDALESELFFDETWDAWLTLQLSEDNKVLRRAFLARLQISHLRDLAVVLFENRDLLDDLAVWSAARSSTATDDFLARLFPTVDELLQTALGSAAEDDAGRQEIVHLATRAKLLKEMSAEQREGFLLNDLKIYARGKQENWNPRDRCKWQKEQCRALKDDLEQAKSQIRSEILDSLVLWVGQFVAFMEERKKNRGILDFQDLLLLTRNLIRDRKDVRGYFQAKFKTLMVDEFQDTDPLQAEIVLFLAEHGSEQADEWYSVKVPPGRLFIVGDPKQSIYRFRRADIELYESVKDVLLDSGGSNQAITRNFRTVPSVLAWVNQIFSQLINKPEIGHYQPDYLPLVACEDRKDMKGRPAVYALTPEEQGPQDGENVPPAPETESADGIKAAEAREIEAAQISALIRQVLNETWQVCDPETEKERPIDYGDVAILFPAMSNVGIYESALQEADIPYRIEGGRQYYQREEVRAVSSALSAIDDPRDAVALVATLRSCLFGVSDDELLLFKHAGGSFDYLSPGEADPEQHPAVVEALTLLAGLHRAKADVEPSMILTRLFSASNCLQIAATRPNGNQRIQNLNKIMALAHVHTDSIGGGSFHRFADWLAGMDLDQRVDVEYPAADEKDPQVRMMTVHGSKGLEFPLVILADTASDGPARKPTLLTDRRSKGRTGFQLRIGSRDKGGYFETQGYVDSLPNEEARAEAERRRLFYVATTRARDYLVISLHAASTKKPGGFRKYFSSFPGKTSAIYPSDLPSAGRVKADPGDDKEMSSEAGAAILLQDLLQQKTKWQAELQTAIERAATPRVFSPSGAHGKITPKQPAIGGTAKPTAERSFNTWEESLGTRFGTAYHKVMEAIDLAAPTGVDGVIARACETVGLPADGQATITTLVNNTLATEPLKRAAKAAKVHRELAVCAIVDGGLFDGQIDMLYEEDGSLVIVDYKSDDVLDEALEERFVEYIPQGRAYAQSASAAIGMPVKQVAFVFAKAAEVRYLPPDQLI